MEGTLTIGTTLDTTGLEKGIKNAEKEFSNEEIDFVSDDQEETINNITKKTSVIGSTITKIASKITGISANIIGIIAKVGVIGAIAGIIILAGNALAKGFESATKNSTELQAKMEYIKFSIQSAYDIIGEKLVGIINWIYDRIIDVLGVIGGIIKAIFNVNIFAKATKENFEAMQNSANAIRKSFAGFDEMTTLDDSGGIGLTKDFASALNISRSLADIVEEMARKIKEYFTPPTAEEFKNQVNERIIQPIIWLYDRTIKPMLEDIWKILEPLVTWVYNNIILPIWNEIVKTFKPIYDWFIENIFNPIKNYINDNFIKPVKGSVNGLFVFIYNSFADMVNYIIRGINNSFGEFGIHINELEYKTLDTNENIEQSIEENIIDKLEETNDMATEITNTDYNVDISNTQINNTNNGLSGIIDKLHQIVNRTWNATIKFFTDSDYRAQKVKDFFAGFGIDLPWLATGGIVNMPSRGVPVGGAMAGERGAEGVIPLTNSQQMELLGEAIGKYITVNASITNTMNGRVISREIQRIQNESDFAFNR